MTTIKGAYDGITVLDFTQGIAGPHASMLLALHGADVIKVEPPEGDWGRALGELKGWPLVRSFLAYHFTRRYPGWAGWLPRHVPRLIPPAPNAGKPLAPAFAGIKDKA